VIICLSGTPQFGEEGPQPGEIGEAFTFVEDDIGDIYFATRFPEHKGFFWVPAERAHGPLPKEFAGKFPLGT
jgi:hypothetical protein